VNIELADICNDVVRKPSGCYEFVGKLNGHGYGVIYYDGKQRTAHRLSWALMNGEIPEDMCICHKCDNRSCVRSDHLFLGTLADNTRDMISKGRDRKAIGEKHFNSSITEEDVRRMREAYLFGAKQTDLCSVYGMYQGSVGKIVRRESWRHVL
jgi:hypothetical protein